MKCIGIVAITTVGANICINEMIKEAAKHDSSGAHPEYITVCFSFDRYKEKVIQKDWEGLGDIILEAIDKLKLAGADFIIIPSNTPHYAIQYIQKKSPLPVLNLIEITVNECIKHHYKKVAVLGTYSTMQEGLYASVLRENKITPVIPSESLCKEIDDLIMKQIIPLKISEKSVKEIAEKIKKLECDAFILGCTELPEVYNIDILGRPVLDTTRLLAHIALEEGLVNLYENSFKF